MWEQSLRVPCVVRYPREVRPGSRPRATLANVDWAPTLLDYAGVGGAPPGVAAGRPAEP